MQDTDIRNQVAANYGDHFTKFGETWKNQVAQLQQKFSGAIEEVRMPVEYPTDVPVLYVKASAIIEILKFAKDEPGFEYGFLSDITVTDEEVEPRFELVYNLYSPNRHWRIRFKVRVAEGEEVPTLTGIWPGANWAEREAWDMFGVKFTGHPDLRRILMDSRWVGHPLRKDYPLRGYQVFPDAQQIDEKLLS